MDGALVGAGSLWPVLGSKNGVWIGSDLTNGVETGTGIFCGRTEPITKFSVLFPSRTGTESMIHFFEK